MSYCLVIICKTAVVVCELPEVNSALLLIRLAFSLALILLGGSLIFLCDRLLRKQDAKEKSDRP